MFTYQHERPMVTVDTVVFRQRERLEVLVVRRLRDPFAGLLALPGGFVEIDEEIRAAAHRELEEETGLSGVKLTQLGAFGKPGRDPRGRTISVVYVGAVANPHARVQGADDAAEALWIPARRPGRLAFDHNDVLCTALRWRDGRPLRLP